ncbi:MAG: RAMP superfamily CRISPR-associated protein [Candidatus Jordarchaeum sp.]|uniref:RAMP superfamily CRISPR-associated protein n=1 Tax=Candidatus Jordarchaeum sp. TaxID=2823881 RepID=UPI004049A128
MKDKVKIELGGKEREINIKKEGGVTFLELPIKVKISEDSFLHIGAAPSPLTEKKGSVFKVDRNPVIPASSFKGALRHQIEILFIEKSDEFTNQFDIPDNYKDILRPCIPAPRPTKTENELINAGKYRSNCEIKVDENGINIDNKLGICPTCYFMGATGIMGFLRINNFYTEGEGRLIDQTNVRIDRKTVTAAHGAKIDGEQVKPGTVFKGNVNVIISDPTLELQKIQFGDARIIGDIIIDKWLHFWKERDSNKKAKFLIENVLINAILNIKVLGGQKSKGAGKITIEIM